MSPLPFAFISASGISSVLDANVPEETEEGSFWAEGPSSDSSEEKSTWHNLM